jgi:hypothetical protein
MPERALARCLECMGDSRAKSCREAYILRDHVDLGSRPAAQGTSEYEARLIIKRCIAGFFPDIYLVEDIAFPPNAKSWSPEGKYTVIITNPRGPASIILPDSAACGMYHIIQQGDGPLIVNLETFLLKGEHAVFVRHRFGWQAQGIPHHRRQLIGEGSLVWCRETMRLHDLLPPEQVTGAWGTIRGIHGPAQVSVDGVDLGVSADSPIIVPQPAHRNRRS